MSAGRQDAGMTAAAFLSSDAAPIARDAERSASSGWLTAVERRFDTIFGEAANPLRQLGALGYFLFWIVAASGGYVYIFFDTSVTGAHASIEALMRGGLGALMRGVHRYSSAAFMLVLVLHLARELIHGRFRGFRWFSWVSGVPLVWLALAAGIGGYWLVWDSLAQFIGVATAEWFGVLPGFGDALIRNFVTAEAVSDRFFSLLVFLHIGIPLLLLLGMWIHVQRVTRPQTRPHRALGWGTLAMLVVLTLAQPALSQAPADLARMPSVLGFDWFYLAGYPLIYAWSPSSLWALAGALTLVLTVLPWLGRIERPAVAVVDPANCNGCARCFEDCPYAAITMVERAGGRTGRRIAAVAADLCAACGICSGACPSSTPFRSGETLVTGIDMPQWPIGDVRERLERGLSSVQYGPRIVLFGCDRGAEVGAIEARGVTAISLPCIGMLPPSFIEFALRSGADGVLVTGCGADCEYRLGARWTHERIARAREPHLRSNVARERVCIAWTGAGQEEQLARSLAAFRETLVPRAAEAIAAPRRREATHA